MKVSKGPASLDMGGAADASPSTTTTKASKAYSQVDQKPSKAALSASDAMLWPSTSHDKMMGRISLAPVTVTTTTTTTHTVQQEFPPIVMNAPRLLREHDPKVYPLASSPTPQAIRNISFHWGGREARFAESDFAEAGSMQTQDQSYRQSPSIPRPTSKSRFVTPPPPRRDTSLQYQPRDAATAPKTNPKKRSASPVSIAEAAEIASLQRRSKKLKGSQHGRNIDSLNDISAIDTDAQLLVTPEADTGSSTQQKAPRTRKSTRSSRLRESLIPSNNTDETEVDPTGPSNLAEEGVDVRDTISEASQQSSATLTENGATGSSDVSSHLMDSSGVSATPPIADTDLDPVIPSAPVERESSAHLRPSFLDTSSINDASLPSPSLSPTTAAANLANAADHPATPPEEEDDYDMNDVSSLDIAQEPHRKRQRMDDSQRRLLGPTKIELPTPTTDDSPNPQLPTPSIMEIPAMLDTFDSMPEDVKTYVMFQLLRRCAKPTLHFIADQVNPALKCDFLGLLPLELSINVIKYLDAQSMCSAAQVSKRWRHIINSDEKAWKDLLDEDGFELPDGEVDRAVREGWGWQYPNGIESWERDLSTHSSSTKETSGDAISRSGGASRSRSDYTKSPHVSGTSAAAQNGEGPSSITNPSSGRPKRKAASKYTSNKRQKRKGPSPSKTRSSSCDIVLDSAYGPNAYASAAAQAVPNPNIGLPSLRNLHLFKSLYQRHHLIRKSWMQEETRPQHIAFRAHQRNVVTCLQFDTDKILTGSDDTNINVYDTKTGALRTRLEGHEGGVWALQYEGNILVSGSTDRSVRVWDIEKGKCLQVFQGHTSTVRCLVILKPTPTGETLNGEPVLMPKEPLIITGSRDSSLRVWKLPRPGDRSIVHAGPPASDGDNPYFVRTLSGHHHSVRAIAARGDLLVSGSYDCTVRVWKISTGEVLHRLAGHSQKVYSVVLDHARNRCISGSMDNLVKVWSLDTGACLFNLEGHSSLVGLLDLSHDRLVSAAADSTLRIWDPENGQCKSTLSAHTGAITCFQHDGQKVISGSDRTLKMWNIKSGECVKDLLTDLSGVWQVKFNERRCVAAVQRNNLTYIEVLDFGASRDGVPPEQRGRRIVVDTQGDEIDEVDEFADNDTL